jgi:hypothetical protein
MRLLIHCGALLGAMVCGTAGAYPLYDSDELDIGRVQAARLAHEGEIPGRAQVSGALLPRAQVDLRLLERRELDVPAADAEFTRQLVALLGNEADRYSLSVLDLSDPSAPRYAEHAGLTLRNPGSVGKIMVGLGLFQGLADAWPDNTEARLRVLRDTVVTADEFILYDSHTVGMWDRAARTLTRRPLEVGDQASLLEYADWMLSASSNAAAAIVMREAMLLARHGQQYPLDDAAARAFFQDTPKSELTGVLERAVQAPMTRNGLDLELLRQGSFFTRTGKQKVPGTSSHGATREYIRFMLRMEQGRLVDEWSSRELKRLLYMTERRIRYASSPALRDAAVYFKSGSWYQCEPEEGFKCRKYHGNKRNLMNSIAIVEAPAGQRTLFYLVALTSNVLRKNSAVDHQTLATRIHRLLEKAHGVSQ